MEPRVLNILLVEDSVVDRTLVETFLDQELGPRFTMEHAASLADALRRLDRHGFDVILLDLLLSDSTGLATFCAIHERARRTPIVVLSGVDDLENAISAVRMGAQDYLVKSKTDSHSLVNSLRFAVERALREKVPQREGKAPTQELAEITNRYTSLTPREREVLDLIAAGNSLKRIAMELGTSYHTVKNQRAAVQKKMAASSEADLVRMVLTARFAVE